MQANRQLSSTPSWPAPSPLTVFLRNVQLLQLDQKPDWPGLSRKLFSSSQKAQAQRVKSVEWVLYHLFLLWCPSDTKNKLRPFFPPLEPLQSVNLRAALFRALSDLKKNGDLGRETIVRKSMLDDCKGPKFEELLAVFSTAVLRKIVCENSPEHGVRLAFAKSLGENEVEENLIPLIIAHHYGLSKARRDNLAIREGHDIFMKLLDGKAMKLSTHSDGTPGVLEEILHPEALAQDVKTNWFASQNVVDVLLKGGSSAEKDDFLNLPFEQAWHHSKGARIGQSSRSSRLGLLQDMETLSLRQRSRIHRLNEFRKSSSHSEQENREKVAIKSPDMEQGLAFRDHQTLTLASTAKALQGPVQFRDLAAEHDAIISSLKSCLYETKSMAIQERSSHSPTTLAEAPPEVQFLNTESALSPKPDTEGFSSCPSPSPSVQVTDYENESRIDSASNHASTPSRPSSVNKSVPCDPLTSDETEPPSLSAPEPQPIALSHPQFEPRRSSLLERTRQSMSLLPPPSNSRSRQSLAARRETRQSQLFPINQFETPPKEAPDHPSRSGASTPRDELFSEEAEYASIFKSRPRVATSPLMSPAVHVGFDHDSEQDIEEGESGLSLVIEGSPLAKKRR